MFKIYLLKTKDLYIIAHIIYGDDMKSDDLDTRILTLLKVLVDHRISPTMDADVKSMILHTFKKFRTRKEIEKILQKYEPFIKSQGY